MGPARCSSAHQADDRFRGFPAALFKGLARLRLGDPGLLGDELALLFGKGRSLTRLRFLCVGSIPHDWLSDDGPDFLTLRGHCGDVRVPNDVLFVRGADDDLLDALEFFLLDAHPLHGLAHLPRVHPSARDHRITSEWMVGTRIKVLRVRHSVICLNSSGFIKFVVRVAVVFKDRCQPKRCHLECIAFCPPQRTGTEVIWIDPETTKAAISEETCISCGICLPAGVPISTDSGVVPIDKMAVGTRVLTHQGRYRVVTRVQTRMYDGPLYRIRVTGQPDSLELTEEHPVLAVIRRPIKGGRRLEKAMGVLRWVRPADLKVGDYLVKPRTREAAQDSWDVPIPMVLSGGRYPQWSDQLISLPLTPDLGRLVGYYLAEGSVDDRRLVFSFHEKDQNYRYDVRSIMHRSFGFRGYETKNTGLGRNVRYDSVVLARVFGSLGKKCDNKCVPPAFTTAPKAVREELVRGLWRGDGHREYDRNYFGIVTTSAHLAYQVQEILSGLGIAAGVTTSSPSGKRRVYHIHVTAEFSQQMATLLQVEFSDTRNRKASHYLVDEDFVYAAIRKIEVRLVESIKVFNLEVDEDQTYTAAGQVVHNCVKKCPFDAIRIIGLPEALKEDLVHQYGKNAFRLFRLPVPKKAEVIGLLGPNGIGKTTCVGLLSREVAPNLGHYRRTKAYWEAVLDYFAGTELHAYLA